MLELSQSRVRRRFARSVVFAVERCHGTRVGIDLLSARLVPVEAMRPAPLFLRIIRELVEQRSGVSPHAACTQTKRVGARGARAAPADDVVCSFGAYVSALRGPTPWPDVC
jgi:hypothetical protein